MFRNYLKITWRNLWKNKSYLFINLMGLAVAFAVSLFLGLVAYFELTYDQFHKENGNVYQVYRKTQTNRDTEYATSCPLPMAPGLKSDFPEVIQAARVLQGYGTTLKDDKLVDLGLVYTDADYLKLFGYKLLKGNPATALSSRNSTVLREDQAEKLFGSEDPIGKTLLVKTEGRDHPYVVTGVLERGPKNSSINNSVLVRIENAAEYTRDRDNWSNNQHDLYLRLQPNVSADDFNRKLRAFTAKYRAESIRQLKSEGVKADENNELISTRLIDITDARFANDLFKGAPSRSLPFVLLGIAAIILLIATVNFVNLTVARSLGRAKEVGMRKALGALRNQVLVQFWGETVIICTGSLLLGILLAVALENQFNTLFRTEVSLSNALNPALISGLLLAFAMITVLAGGYPALAVSKFNTVEILKGKNPVKSGSGKLRNSLMVFQFTMSVLFIICTLVVWHQVNYLKKQPLGYNTQLLYSIPVTGDVQGRDLIRNLRNSLSSQPRILDITGADINLGRGSDGSFGKSQISFTQENRTVRTNMRSVDYDFLKTLDIKLLDGRDFSPAHADSSSVVINESLAKELGFKHPVGQFMETNPKVQIVGVFKDFNFESLHQSMENLALFVNHDFGIYYIFVKMAPDNVEQTIAQIKQAYGQFNPKSEFSGSFVDQNIENQYRKEQRLTKMFMVGASIAIILSCMGLFAVAVMTIAQRTKEIGIRKTLGASVAGVVALLSRDFVRLVLIAIVLASPIAWFLMDKWLQNFPYRTDVEWWIFVVAGVVTIAITLATVSFQSIKAALANPVKSLRSE